MFGGFEPGFIDDYHWRRIIAQFFQRAFALPFADMVRKDGKTRPGAGQAMGIRGVGGISAALTGAAQTGAARPWP
jgi:hypothetical protein